MQPKELEKIPLRVEAMYLELQDRIMQDIVRRLHKTKGISSTADYQIERLSILGNSTEFIEDELKRVSGKRNEEIWQIYEDVIDKEYTRNKTLYEKINREFVPYDENTMLQGWTKAIIQQTNNDIVNLTGSLGFSLVYGGKRHFTPLSEYYQKYLDRACVDVVTGSFDYGTVLRRVVKEMADSGIRTVDYATGYSSRVPVAARRAIMTGVNQLSAQINDQVAADLGTDQFEITYHAGARPSHWWGGMVFSRKDLESVCGLGRVDGLCGANCRHNYLAFISGISTRTYTDEQLAQMREREQEPKEWHGRPYTTYEATQKQRSMETAMRVQRERVRLLQAGKADQEDVLLAKARYQAQLNEYAAFSKKMGIPQQRERIYMDLKGRVAPNMFTNYVDSGIIKEKKMYRKKGTQSIEPMPKKQLQKITKSFKKNGGIIQMNDSTDAYLKMKKAEAITYNSKTILLQQHPSRSAVFEELIHATQYRQGKNDGSLKARLLCEIEAQEKLLKYQKSYKLTKSEILQTERALKSYQKELSELMKGDR